MQGFAAISFTDEMEPPKNQFWKELNSVFQPRFFLDFAKAIFTIPCSKNQPQKRILQC